MKKTLLLLLSAIAFAISSFANLTGGDTIVDLSNYGGGTRPRFYATQNVEIDFELRRVTMQASCSGVTVNVQFVRLENGVVEVHETTTYDIVEIPDNFSPRYVVVLGDDTLILVGQSE